MIVVKVGILIGFSILACGVVHEVGHLVAAQLLGYKISFRFVKFRGIWDMPDAPAHKQAIMALSGFGLEFLVALLAGPVMSFIATLHFLAYPFYAGEASDFKWYVLKKSGSQNMNDEQVSE
jgi:hypothetical protein